MISEARAEEKLMELVDLFQSRYREKEYRKAKICYDSARTIVSFLELPEERMVYYFGSRELEIEGAFPEQKVQDVMLKVSVITEAEHRQEVERKMQYLENRRVRT